MFPHNSSSHEISTETNAFVQNSMGDVVVLEKNSPIGVGEGRESENDRYCDIEFINNNMMAKPISHLENTAANDLLTVLSNQTGKFVLTSRSSTCQSVASSTTKYPTKNHLLTYNNTAAATTTTTTITTTTTTTITTTTTTNTNNNINNKNKNNNNRSSSNSNNNNNNPKLNDRSNRAEHNHQDDRKITVNITTKRKPGSPGNYKPGSSANNSKSMSKTLSDNKTSFSVLNIRVLSISVNLRLTGDKCAIDEGVPSLVRIPKSDRPSSGHFSLDSLDNYSLLGSCLHSGKYNNIKSNSSLLSNYNDNYKSVILLSSTSNHYFLRVEMDGGAIAMRLRTRLNPHRFLTRSSFDGLSLRKEFPSESQDGYFQITRMILLNVAIIRTKHSLVDFNFKMSNNFQKLSSYFTLREKHCWVQINLELAELLKEFPSTHLTLVVIILKNRGSSKYELPFENQDLDESYFLKANFKNIKIYAKHVLRDLTVEDIFLTASNQRVVKFFLPYPHSKNESSRCSFHLEIIIEKLSECVENYTKMLEEIFEIDSVSFKVWLKPLYILLVKSFLKIIRSSSITDSSFMEIDKKREEILKNVIPGDILFINNNINVTKIDENYIKVTKPPLNFVTLNKIKTSDRSSDEGSSSIKKGENVATSSSITLIVPGNDQPPRPLPLSNAPKRAQSSPSWLDLVANELTQRACVPLSLDCKLYVVKLSCKVICDFSITWKGRPSHETSYKGTHLNVQSLSIFAEANDMIFTSKPDDFMILKKRNSKNIKTHFDDFGKTSHVTAFIFSQRTLAFPKDIGMITSSLSVTTTTTTINCKNTSLKRESLHNLLKTFSETYCKISASEKQNQITTLLHSVGLRKLNNEICTSLKSLTQSIKYVFLLNVFGRMYSELLKKEHPNAWLSVRTSEMLIFNLKEKTMEMLSWIINGISDVATITVGALSFQDNVKSNEPSGTYFASCRYSGSYTRLGPGFVKSLSKSTVGDRFRVKGENQDEFALYIPTMTTCKPTMTLTRQSASRIIGVPGSRPNYFEILWPDQMHTPHKFYNSLLNCLTEYHNDSLPEGENKENPLECFGSFNEQITRRNIGENINCNVLKRIKSQTAINLNDDDHCTRVRVFCFYGFERNYCQNLHESVEGGDLSINHSCSSLLKQTKLKYQTYTGVRIKQISSGHLCDLHRFNEIYEIYQPVGFNVENIFAESLINPKQFTLTSSTFQTAHFIDNEGSNVMKMDAIVVDLRHCGQLKKCQTTLQSKNKRSSERNSITSASSKQIFCESYPLSGLSEKQEINNANGTDRTHLIDYARNLIAATVGISKDVLQVHKNDLKHVLMLLFGPICDLDEFNLGYKRRWGIPGILKLVGGGESSLNSGGSTNWGSTQTSATSNNNNSQSGWGGSSGNPSGSSGAPGNWSGNNVNRSVPGNTNPNQNQGPPGGQNVPGSVNKVNNPNQQSNQQSGPPTSQSGGTSQGQNNNQWSQGKSSNPGGPSQNSSGQNNNNTAQQQQQQQQQSNSSSNNNQPNNQTQGSVNSSNTPASNNPSTKQQLEQLNTVREALFSQDGWGCQNVNQDTNWDVPNSPEPNMSKDGGPMWKTPVNNGTDLWEANLRNGGQPPPQQQAKTPWGHTPATNIGGTWGEDDEAADSSSMWSGAPTSSQPNSAAAGQWTTGTGNQTGMWGGSNWGDPRIDHRDPRDLRSVDPREIRDPRDHRMSLDPREHMRVMDPMARDPRMADMRGDPRGISGRLNGTNADAMWGQPPAPPHHQMGHQHPSGPPPKMLNPSNINQWAAPPPKDIMPGKPSGWEEPSPPTQRRNVPNYDDGTSLWGNPAANQRTIPGSKVSHWKDLPTPNLGRGGMQCPPGMPQNRMPGQPGMKPDVSGPMWGHPGAPGGRNGSWAEGPHDTTSWDDPKTPSTWNEAQLNPGTWGGPSAHKPKPMGPSGSWADTDMDPTPNWGHPTKPTLTKEVIWNSREFRYLCDLGFKKEDVELALRNREMNREEALELLSQVRPLDQWRRHDAHSTYDPTNQATTAPAYPRFNHVAQQMSFPPGAGVPSGNATGSVGGSVASASLLKLQQQQQQTTVPLQQQQPSSNAPQPPFNQASRAPQNQPSTQQLRMLVQQIQLAVQEGYLNHQILNQPLAPQTLILLNQLLQQIKVLQQLHQQHSVQSTMKGNGQSVLQISVQITKTKQQIANLQNQIAVQQATYMKQQQQQQQHQQQQQQQQHPVPPSQSSEYYKSSVHDPVTALQNSFTDLTMNKEPPVSQQQSRLNQWKLPSLDKDGELVTNEFSRAPGTTSKPAPTPAGLTRSHSSPNMNPLLGQGDGTWSTRLGESGWPDPGNTDSTDGKDWQPTGATAGAAAFTDLVPEFEPGKPWKGTQMKSIEDDPSITPGSIVRSPLSLATIKDPDAIFSSSSKTSPPPQQQPTNPDTSIPSLSNSTWTFNPPATTPNAFTSLKNTWGESAPPPTAVTSELWGAPMSKVRGPPPGLGNKAAGNTSNGWAGFGTVSRSSSWGFQSSTNAAWVSTWLLLKNLTPQIDGSTLKTLCMQHGPVQDFRLYLNHGIALTKYSSRDEAIKAQGALNNCVLGNTTIFAESPADTEVHSLLQQLSHGGQQQAGATTGAGWGLRPSNKTGPPPDTWGGSSSQLWGAPPSSNSLWSNAGIDSNDQQRATPSSLNSYLPGDLLGEKYVCGMELNRRNMLHSMDS